MNVYMLRTEYQNLHVNMLFHTHIRDGTTLMALYAIWLHPL